MLVARLQAPMLVHHITRRLQQNQVVVLLFPVAFRCNSSESCLFSPLLCSRRPGRKRRVRRVHSP